MYNGSDVRRIVEKALARAIELKVDANKDIPKQVIVDQSLSEFNKAFEGIYKIDNIKLTETYVGVSISKDKDFGEEELAHA